MTNRNGRARPALVAAASAILAGFALGHAQDVTVTKDLVIPVSDGSHLLADLYRSSSDAASGISLPTVVTVFPYKKDDSYRSERGFMEEAARAGFTGLLVDVRGTGRSPGTFCLMCEREIRDGYEVVEWAAAQAFSDGNVGVFGYSYPASVAAHVAALAPPHLEAAVAASSFSDPYRDIVFPGGMAASEDDLSAMALFLFMPNVRGGSDTPFPEHPKLLTAAATSPATVALEAALHDTYDDFWKERALENKAHGIRVPTLWLSGWDDIYVRGVPRNFLDSTGAEHTALIMGPWGHLAQVRGDLDELVIRNALEWFDLFLREPQSEEEDAARDARIASLPKVRLFDLDPTSSETFAIWKGRWREFVAWPPDHDDVVLEPCAGGAGLAATNPWPQQGSLVDSCETAAQIPVVSAPVEATGPRSILHDGDTIGLSDALDQRANLTALAFLGPELTEPVTITGPATLELTAIATNVDADWVARVVDVGPSGARLVAQGRLRASHREEDPDRGYLRHVHDEPEPLTPGETYELTIEIWPTSSVIAAAHRIGLLLQTADTAKTLPFRPSSANVVLVGPDANTRLSLPVRTDDGEIIPSP